jgi:hypothetical protein
MLAKFLMAALTALPAASFAADSYDPETAWSVRPTLSLGIGIDPIQTVPLYGIATFQLFQYGSADEGVRLFGLGGAHSSRGTDFVVCPYEFYFGDYDVATVIGAREVGISFGFTFGP